MGEQSSDLALSGLGCSRPHPWESALQRCPGPSLRAVPHWLTFPHLPWDSKDVDPYPPEPKAHYRTSNTAATLFQLFPQELKEQQQKKPGLQLNYLKFYHGVQFRRILLWRWKCTEFFFQSSVQQRGNLVLSLFASAPLKPPCCLYLLCTSVAGGGPGVGFTGPHHR